MSDAALVDTNVLVYAADSSDETRHTAAEMVLEVLGPRRIVVSGQVLAECANVLTHPRKHALGNLDIARVIERMAAGWRVIPLDATIVVAALKARERWQLEYYDAQIWAAAAVSGIAVVLSEDFAPCTLGGVRFVDPFAPGFDPAEL